MTLHIARDNRLVFGTGVMRSPHRTLSCLAWAAALILGASGQTAAQEAEHDKAGELVPADLKEWAIEFTEPGFRKKRILAIDETGTYQVKTDRGRELFGKLSREEAGVVLNGTREMFNRFQIAVAPQLQGETLDLVVKVRVEQGRAIRLHLSPGQLNRLGGSHGFDQVAQAFKTRKVDFVDRFARMLVLTEPQEPMPADRFPDKRIEPSFHLYRLKDGAPAGSGLSADIDAIRFSPPVQGVEIALTADDRERRYLIGRKILNRFQLRAPAPNDDRRELKLFNIGCGLTFTCDREMLVDMGVLDDLDAWAKDINRRFEAAGFKERFAAPWAE